MWRGGEGKLGIGMHAQGPWLDPSPKEREGERKMHALCKFNWKYGMECAVDLCLHYSLLSSSSIS